jgi:hypothetical protein
VKEYDDILNRNVVSSEIITEERIKSKIEQLESQIEEWKTIY